MENPNTIPEMFSAAYSLHQAGNLSDAESLYRTILASDPYHADALMLLVILYLQQGNALRELKRYDEALVSYDKAILHKPDYADIYNNRGVALEMMHRYDEALASYDKAVLLRPDYADAYNNMGIALQSMKRYEEALTSYDRVIAIKPGYADAYYNRGLALQSMKRYGEALASYDQAIALAPTHAVAYNNRGITLRELKQYDAALESFDQAVRFKPGYADAYNNKGLALQIMHRYQDALAYYDQAIAANPNLAEVYNNRGNTLQDLLQYDAALESFKKAILLNPDYANAYYNQGNALRDLKRYEEARASYEKALALAPDTPNLLGALLHSKMQLCDWHGMESVIAKLAEAIEENKPSASPFAVTATPLSLAQQRKCAEIYVESKYPPAATRLWNGEKYTHDKIRVGYFSADFHNHATAYLTAELFERHDRAKFEITAFSFGASAKDAMRERLEKGFDRFIDVRDRSDFEIAALARKIEIDIAVDLKGFTQEARTGIFTLRPAPVQVSYLGYPGTMGAGYIDYIIADATVIPEHHKRYYSEKIVTLPHSYQVNDSSRKISDGHFTRAEMGLPEQGFVFCCFNNNYKINAGIFDIWMRLLKTVEGSVLWLFVGNPASAQNLRKEAESRGVKSDRLVFATQMPLPDHLARQRLADLFLDTFPYNAHTTASDALWAGLPVLTYPGETFASRVAASLLNAVELPELITQSPKAYEALALELATDPKKLSALRRKLAENLPSCPLFNATLFARHIEDAYAQMLAKSHAGLPPGDIHVLAWQGGRGLV